MESSIPAALGEISSVLGEDFHGVALGLPISLLLRSHLYFVSISKKLDMPPKVTLSEILLLFVSLEPYKERVDVVILVREGMLTCDIRTIKDRKISPKVYSYFHLRKKIQTFKQRNQHSSLFSYSE